MHLIKLFSARTMNVNQQSSVYFSCKHRGGCHLETYANCYGFPPQLLHGFNSSFYGQEAAGMDGLLVHAIIDDVNQIIYVEIEIGHAPPNVD